MVEAPLLLIVALVMFIGALIQGVTGFGFVMVAAPIVTIFIEPQTAVPVMLLGTSLLNLVVLYHGRHHLRLQRVWPMLLAGAAAAPLGAVLLVVLDAGVLKVMIGAVVGVTALAMLAGFRRPVRGEAKALVPVGAASGVLNSSTGLAGPPVVLFFTNQGVDARVFRTNIVAHFTAINLTTFPSFVVGGVLTWSTVVLALQLLPAIGAGVIVGILLSRHVREQLFLRIALFLVVFAGAGSIAAGIAT